MSRLRGGPLAAWSTAWLAGMAASDEVLRAVTGSDAPHQVAGLGGPASDGAPPAPLSEILIEWRRCAETVRLALPVAGDVRGLPGPAAFRRSALEAGEAVFGGPLGLVPAVRDSPATSAPASVVWRAFVVDEPAPDPLSVADAQHELTEAIRTSASALAAADVASRAADVGEALGRARRAGDYVNLPPGFPPRAVQLVAQAERLQAVLDLALADPIGGAVDRVGIAARDEALRPLATAVRRARVAGYNAGGADYVG